MEEEAGVLGGAEGAEERREGADGSCHGGGRLRGAEVGEVAEG